MVDKSAEWLKQAEYDLDTAEFMFTGGGYFYSVFMCHLSVEKALKGLFQKKLNETPPKVHNLVYLLNKTSLKPSEKIGRFIIRLNEASITTRYPENIEKIKKDYTKAIVSNIINGTSEVLEWIKEQF